MYIRIHICICMLTICILPLGVESGSVLNNALPLPNNRESRSMSRRRDERILSHILAQDKGGPHKGGFPNNRLFS